MNNEAQTEEIPDSTRDLDIEHDRKLMIEDLNKVTSSYKLSPLDLAIKLGNIEAIQVLLERNVEHNIDKSLQSAVKLKREDIVKFLLERYETLNPATIYEGKSCFHIACGINYSKIIIPLAEYSFLRKQSIDSTNDPVAKNNTMPIARI